jgi:AraC-like DNA-binding protein
MAEKSKSPIFMYFKTDKGILHSGYHTDNMEIIQVTQGAIECEIGTDKVFAGEGDFVFVPSGLVFRIISEEVATIRSIVFSSEIISENMENFESDIFYMFYVQSRNRITVFSSTHPIYESLVFAMDNSHDEFVSKDVCYRLPIRANVYLMMTQLLRYYCDSKDDMSRMIYHNVLRLRPCIDYIDAHFTEKIYIETLADMIMVSNDYFTKMFKDSIGKTPIDYINGLRINKALTYLSTTDVSINDISDSIGFSGPNYFHKIFKQYMQISPLAYRKSSLR